MNRTSQIAYGVAAACFTVILSMATTPEWWDANPFIATMLGASIPLCILGAWLSEFKFKDRSVRGFRFVSHSPTVMRVAAWCGIILGLFSITLFLFTVSIYLALGFIVGSIILNLFTDVQEAPTND